MPTRLTQEGFVERAQKVWGDRYDLSHAFYRTSYDNIDVVCREHGVFSVKANNFLMGHGCPKCGIESNKRKQRRTTDEFTAKAAEIHKGKYDYRNVEYNGQTAPVEIICKTHGPFYQKPSVHLRGFGCPACSGQKRHTEESFVEKARAIHGMKYDYSKLGFNTIKDDVTIICPVHGEFKMIGHYHLQGQGCSLCKESHGEIAICAFLEKHGIHYEREKTFPGLKDKKSLRFDFYLPKENTCIEFQGAQHYYVTRHFKDNKDAFQRRQRRDQIKRDYCSANGIRLIEIKYDQNVEEELTKQLLSCKNIL